ncbi:MAG: T9SS type A sorting domain-containing protein, partial [Bacteroidales bacterium]|nr:T9SS type A sorting domain-containing protein [Bacteroidales bacterium]
PNATAMEIFNAICKSADRYTFPDFDYGFGIPDFVLANALLGASENLNPDCPLTVFPNPFSNDLYIFFHNEMQSAVSVTLYDIAGNEVFRKQYPHVAGTDYLKIDRDLDRLLQGVYIIGVNAVNFSENARLIKF